MFNKKKTKEEVEIDKKKVNDVLTLLKKILNVLYILSLNQIKVLIDVFI